jgi:hypothetical protein
MLQQVRMWRALFVAVCLLASASCQFEDINIGPIAVQGRPSSRPSNYNRTEILEKYSQEQLSRSAIIAEKSRIFQDWDIRS